jgi:hypothetical protein
MDVKKMNEWISVKDKFPQPGVFVLVTSPRDFENSLNIGINVYSKKHGWELKTTNCYAAGITHWMPLPEPPK